MDTRGLKHMRTCNNYLKNMENHPELVGEECKTRKGKFEDWEIGEHFWKSGGGRSGTCRHCEKQKRFVSDNTYDPVITRNWPRDENGRLLSYWHVIDKNIILKVEND